MVPRGAARRTRVAAHGAVLALLVACGDDPILVDARLDAAPPGSPADVGPPRDAALPDAGAGVLHPARYPVGERHSPLSPFVAASLQSVGARADGLADDVFAKIGDSVTVSRSFATCFDDGDAFDLDGRPLEATRAFFAAGDAAGSSPFERESLAAEVGWHAGRALDGDPSPLAQELDATSPRWALVMYGTNDLNIVSQEDYAENVLDLSDALLDRGVVPILSSIPPRGDDPTRDADVPVFNAIVRAIAQARQVPFVDYHAELVGLPGQGLGGDDLHPSAFSGGACVLTAEGLDSGYNVRNLLALEALDRVKRVVLDGEAPPDAAGDPILGDGSPDAPFVIDRFPFTHHANTSVGEHSNIDAYACAPDLDESGPEYLYRLELDAPRDLRFQVFDRGEVDIDVHLLDEASGSSCRMRAHRLVEASLEAGTYYLALDTFVSGRELAGEYLLIVMEQP